jgi:acyl dehydratase
MDWTVQRHWEDVEEGQEVTPVSFPLSVYRLVVEAGANRDFNSIHHNSEFARATGAPEMYANTGFLLGMWERTIREFIGLEGTVRRIAGFRMRVFNTVGKTVTVRGTVKRKWREDGAGLVDLELWSEVDGGVTVGPGVATVTLPSAKGEARASAAAQRRTS